MVTTATLPGCAGPVEGEALLGLPAGHPERYRSVICRDLVDHVDLPTDQLQSLPTDTVDVESRSSEYEDKIAAAGGVDIQLLGIGDDGHIGFNEPTSSLASRTRLKTLTDQTRAANSRFFGDNIDAVPRHVITQGIGTILEAARIVLVAWGRPKPPQSPRPSRARFPPSCPPQLFNSTRTPRSCSIPQRPRP